MPVFPDASTSPFRRPDAAPLDPAKFRDPGTTAKGERRAVVPLSGLTTLWFNTGTLCNLACATCYIESSPTNDALLYLSAGEVARYLDEIARERLPVREIGLTGGEPFMNRDIIQILDACLGRGFDTLVLTNAMRPMRRFEAGLLRLLGEHGARLTLRVSLDHHSRAVHEAERGAGTWAKALDGLNWLAANGFTIAVAGRILPGESEQAGRAGYQALFDRLGLAIPADDPARLVLFPEMDSGADIAEISEGCWSILGKAPASVMCASSRMVVKRKGESGPRVAACTLLPYQRDFDMGATLAEASRAVALNHPHCARFCVLGGASCSA
jgi:uncharacterized Fe-S cluster-containing radical SAM superfamily protein